MPSTRKQNGNEERSRQSDSMPDLKDTNMMIGTLPEKEYRIRTAAKIV